jgi:1-deoxy-D-xylulose-5-phosphate synthase
LLDQVSDIEALRALPQNQLSPLADEIREFIIQSVSDTGGHLSASLGTVELSVALHYVFNTPDDRLVWDVGHQAYAHKILTGRRQAMATLRQPGGLSGFLKREESPFDAFGAGHSSTSISAALGMAMAASLQDSDRHAVAIIGDGALTAGMAFEALNHAGHIADQRKSKLLVILNDNEMSISPNVGGLSNYLAKLLSGKLYTTMREGGKKVLSVVPTVRQLARRAEEHIKGMVIPGTLFEELGFNYIGPIDGHDIDTLVTTLTNMKGQQGPQFLHVVTQKGKGYQPAESNPCTYHGVPPFNPETGKMESKVAGTPSYTQIFGDWLCDMAAEDERLVAITPAMCEGSGLVGFARQFPQRFFDVGIAEQHSVTMAAGLACEGLKPVVAIYSTFLQRAYDQLIHDVAIQDLPVLFAIDRAGIVGPDGATHAGSFDLSYLRCIPNMVVMTPSDENECRQMLTTGFHHPGPATVRYPRDNGTGVTIDSTLSAQNCLPIGKAALVRQSRQSQPGQRVAILAFGTTLAAAQEAGNQLDASVVNMRFVKPLDENMIIRVAGSHDLLITIEENAVQGGAGSAVSECLASLSINTPIKHLGLPDRFSDQGQRGALLHRYGLDSATICATVEAFLEQPESVRIQTVTV